MSSVCICMHKNTKIWEPHLAGARKCLDCGMAYNPNLTPAWHVETPSLEEQVEELRAKLAAAEKQLQELGNEYAVVCHFKEKLAQAEAELALARERLGPAGWEVLKRVQQAEAEMSEMRSMLEQIASMCPHDDGDNGELCSCWYCAYCRAYWVPVEGDIK